MGDSCFKKDNAKSDLITPVLNGRKTNAKNVEKAIIWLMTQDAFKLEPDEILKQKSLCRFWSFLPAIIDYGFLLIFFCPRVLKISKLQ